MFKSTGYVKGAYKWLAILTNPSKVSSDLKEAYKPRKAKTEWTS